MRGDVISRRTFVHCALSAAGAVAVTRANIAATASETVDTSPSPKGSHSLRVEAVGYSELDGRPAFKLAITERNGRWYLYTGHFWHRGWSVIDITDPRRPEVIEFLNGPANTFTGQVDLHGDTMITALERGLTNAPWGFDKDAPFEEGVILWDLSNPARPKQVGRWHTGARGTHRNTYAGGRYIHLAATAPGYDGYIYRIVDIADRNRPQEVGRWAVPGQEKDPGTPPDTPISARQQRQLHEAGFCNIEGKDVFNHGPPVLQGNLAWLPYSAAGVIVLDISDVRRPHQVGRLSFSPPFHSFIGVHGVLPVPERGIAFVNSEDTSYGKGPAHFASIVDIRDPARPFLLSLFPEPTPPSGASYADFHERGGWSGPHNINHLQHNPAVQKQGDLFYIAHFNAGLRVYDVSNKRLPREVGFFMPPEPRRRYGPMPEGALVTQTEDVLVDRRGYIYISDKNQGLWILRYTGDAGTREA
jgi:hypothetical protein